MKPDYPHIDENCLDELRDLTGFESNPARFQTIIKVFLDTLEPSLNSLRETLEAGATTQLADLAHGLKGSAAGIGTLCLASLCAKLEEQCLSRDLRRARATFQQVEFETLAVRRRLEQELSPAVARQSTTQNHF